MIALIWALAEQSNVHTIVHTKLNIVRAFIISQLSVSSGFESQQKHPRTTHALAWRSLNKLMSPEHIVN
jgi:hypothetical protein